MRLRAQIVELLNCGIMDTTGDFLNAGKVNCYEIGTTTPKALYTNSGLTIAAANPVVLDAYGRSRVYGLGGYKFVVDRSDDSSLFTVDDYQLGSDGLLWCGNSTGSSNAYTVAPEAFPGELLTGMRISFTPNHTNTGASTLNASPYGVKNIAQVHGSATYAGLIQSGQIVELVYDGTNWVLFNPAAAWQSFAGGSITAASTLSVSWKAVTQHRYFRMTPKKCEVSCQVFFTIASGTGNWIAFPMPIVASTIAGSPFTMSYLSIGGTVEEGLYNFDPTNDVIGVYRNGFANFPSSGEVVARFEGFYGIA